MEQSQSYRGCRARPRGFRQLWFGVGDPLRFGVRNTAFGVAAVALIGVVAALGGTHLKLTPVTLLTVLGLGAAIVGAVRFPVQVHQTGRIYFSNVPLFLIAVSQPPAFGAAVALVASFVGWTTAPGWNQQCRVSDNLHFCFMISARWSLLVLVGSFVAHIPGHGVAGESAVLLTAAAVMWLWDGFTVPIALDGSRGETALGLIAGFFRMSTVLEVPQYLIGVLGAAAAATLPWSPVLLVIPVALLYVNGKRTKELQDSTKLMLENLADAVDLRDPYTGGHSRRVTAYVESTLARLAVADAEQAMILTAARVHDIGKIGVPDGILNKPGLLTDAERATIQEHAAAGAKFLARHQDFAAGVAVVRHHHESWDGSGYPDGLTGAAIPFGSRIIAVADSYDAMTSDRPYRAGMSHAQALSVLREGRGLQWDPEIVDAFITVRQGDVQEVTSDAPGPVSLTVPSAAAA